MSWRIPILDVLKLLAKHPKPTADHGKSALICLTPERAVRCVDCKLSCQPSTMLMR